MRTRAARHARDRRPLSGDTGRDAHAPCSCSARRAWPAAAAGRPSRPPGWDARCRAAPVAERPRAGASRAAVPHVRRGAGRRRGCSRRVALRAAPGGRAGRRGSGRGRSSAARASSASLRRRGAGCRSSCPSARTRGRAGSPPARARARRHRRLAPRRPLRTAADRARPRPRRCGASPSASGARAPDAGRPLRRHGQAPDGRPGTTYGCCALALSAHQTDLPAAWDGLDRLAIHGTQSPATIGVAASLGCLHASDRDLRRLMRTVPLGAPGLHPRAELAGRAAPRATSDDRCERVGREVGAAQRREDARATERAGLVQQRRDPGGARRLDEQARRIRQPAHGARRRPDSLTITMSSTSSSIPTTDSPERLADADPVGHGVHALARHRLAPPPRERRRGRALRAHADDPHARARVRAARRRRRGSARCCRPARARRRAARPASVSSTRHRPGARRDPRVAAVLHEAQPGAPRRTPRRWRSRRRSPRRRPPTRAPSRRIASTFPGLAVRPTKTWHGIPRRARRVGEPLAEVAGRGADDAGAPAPRLAHPGHGAAPLERADRVERLDLQRERAPVSCVERRSAAAAASARSRVERRGGALDLLDGRYDADAHGTSAAPPRRAPRGSNAQRRTSAQPSHSACSAPSDRARRVVRAPDEHGRAGAGDRRAERAELAARGGRAPSSAGRGARGAAGAAGRRARARRGPSRRARGRARAARRGRR